MAGLQVIGCMALELDRVREIAERVAASSGLEVVEVEFRGSGKARMLRVFLDKPGAASGDPLAGVTHEDCANFSREFGTILDVEDVMPGSYTLEVSSPGLDRKLTKAAEFERFVGSRLKGDDEESGEQQPVLRRPAGEFSRRTLDAGS